MNTTNRWPWLGCCKNNEGQALVKWCINWWLLQRWKVRGPNIKLKSEKLASSQARQKTRLRLQVGQIKRDFSLKQHVSFFNKHPLQGGLYGRGKACAESFFVLVGCPVVPWLSGISQFDVNKTFSMTVRTTLYHFKYPAGLFLRSRAAKKKRTEDGKCWQENYAF